MINFTVYLYDTNSGIGRAIYKDFQWPVLPRVDEDINFDLPHAAAITAGVTNVWHNFGDEARIEVKCENVNIVFLRQMYKGKTGWQLYDTTENRFFSDDEEVAEDSETRQDVYPPSDPREPALVVTEPQMRLGLE